MVCERECAHVGCFCWVRVRARVRGRVRVRVRERVRVLSHHSLAPNANAIFHIKVLSALEESGPGLFLFHLGVVIAAPTAPVIGGSSVRGILSHS